MDGALRIVVWTRSHYEFPGKPKACTGGVGWGAAYRERKENSAIPKTLNSFEGPILPHGQIDRYPHVSNTNSYITSIYLFICLFICFVYEINAL
jgi:hypothetical protein